MNTPRRKHKPKDQLLSKPVKLKTDPVLLDMAGGETVQPDESTPAAKQSRWELS